MAAECPSHAAATCAGYSATSSVAAGESNFRAELERGTDIAIELRYDEPSSAITIVYDHDVSDELPGTVFGPFTYGGTRSLTSTTYLSLIAIGSGASNGVVDNWSILPSSATIGDFNRNGVLDAADIDQLSEQVRSKINDLGYDLNADTLVNDMWLQ